VPLFLSGHEEYCDCVSAVEDQQLSEYALQVVLYRTCTNVQMTGNFLIAFAKPQVLHDLNFALAQAVLNIHCMAPV
jgi:hypothetical protein